MQNKGDDGLRAAYPRPVCCVAGRRTGREQKPCLVVLCCSFLAPPDKDALRFSAGALEGGLDLHRREHHVRDAAEELGLVGGLHGLVEFSLAKAVPPGKDGHPPVVADGELAVGPPREDPLGFVLVDGKIVVFLVFPIELDGRTVAHGRVVSHGLLVAADHHGVEFDALPCGIGGIVIDAAGWHSYSCRHCEQEVSEYRRVVAEHSRCACRV